MYLNNLLIFSGLGNNFFYFTMSKKQLFFFVRTKDKTIFFSAYYSKPTGHAANFHNNMCNSDGCESSVGLQRVSG